MIVREHIPSYRRLAPYMQPEMLMLGNQANTSGWQVPCPYTTLDPDGGDLRFDLSAMPRHDSGHTVYSQFWKTVFNLGTLEHIWDVREAYVAAAHMVAVGGYFLGASPVAGWEGHGIHVTDPAFLLSFFTLNGFEIVDHWFATQAGGEYQKPTRNCGKSVTLWFAARRLRVVTAWVSPSQIYSKGVKPC